MQLAVSIVVYHSDSVLLEETMKSLVAAVELAQRQLKGFSCSLVVFENELTTKANSMQVAKYLDALLKSPFRTFEIRSDNKNVGYANGHNLALVDADSDYHLILNPDVRICPNALVEGLKYLGANDDVVLATPYVTSSGGAQLYLSKRYPKLLDLLLRGFAPEYIKKRFHQRLDSYEMKDVISAEREFKGVELASGCFMLVKADAWRKVGGFDPRYFLYFEDFDFSIRLHTVGQIAFFPAMKIVHHGGSASKKGLSHLRLFIASMIKFYLKHGLFR